MRGMCSVLLAPGSNFQVRLGEKKDVPSVQHYSANVGEHILTVVFRYRPLCRFSLYLPVERRSLTGRLAYLQANNIVPLPTPPPQSNVTTRSYSLSRKRKTPVEPEIIEISDTEDEETGNTPDDEVPADDMEDEEDEEEIYQANIARMEVSIVYLSHWSIQAHRIFLRRLT